MDSEYQSYFPKFGFAFNDTNFSDRILNIHIIPHDGPVGDEAVDEDDDPQALRVKTIHINSLIFAGNSPFFQKMFCNGMRESEQRHAILRIRASEEEPLMDVLNFMYSGTLSATTPRALLDVLIAADKYDVAFCVRYCSKMLLNLPMTCESALFYLNMDLPSSVSLAEAVQPLKDSAKQFLAVNYKDVTKFHDEVLQFPLAAIEAVFSSDDLQVNSEDDVCDFLAEWMLLHFPELKERREVFVSRLGPLLRFQYMTVQKLQVVVKDLFVNDMLPYSCIPSENVERAYKCIPIKVVSFESPHHQCIMYLQLKREECLKLFPSGQVHSQSFQLCGRDFFLCAKCITHHRTSLAWFGLYLEMKPGKKSIDLSSDLEIAVREKPTEKYVIKHQGVHYLTGSEGLRLLNKNTNSFLFCKPWTEFMGDYFINGTFHIRADLTVTQREVR